MIFVKLSLLKDTPLQIWCTMTRKKHPTIKQNRHNYRLLDLFYNFDCTLYYSESSFSPIKKFRLISNHSGMKIEHSPNFIKQLYSKMKLFLILEIIVLVHIHTSNKVFPLLRQPFRFIALSKQVCADKSEWWCTTTSNRTQTQLTFVLFLFFSMNVCGWRYYYYYRTYVKMDFSDLKALKSIILMFDSAFLGEQSSKTHFAK